MVRRTVGGAGGFEERRKGERFKLALPVQLKNGAGITRDISTSGIFFETESAHSIGDTIRLLRKFRTRDPPVRGTRGAGGAAQWSIRRRRGAERRMFFVENERVLNADGK